MVIKGREKLATSVDVEGQTFAYFSPHLPKKVYVGIIGCYSDNRFYDFSVKRQP